MKPSHLIAAGMGVGLFGGALLLMTLPSLDLPCEISVNYKGKYFERSGKSAFRGTIKEVRKTIDLRGTGRIRGSRIVCEVDLQKEGSI